MRQQDCCILLTATITPNASRAIGGPEGMLTDPVIRRQQYVDALRWYLDNTKAKIVFAENSGAYDIVEEFVNYGGGGGIRALSS